MDERSTFTIGHNRCITDLILTQHYSGMNEWLEEKENVRPDGTFFAL